MSVDQTDVIDFCSRAPNGDCVLTISDHLEWSPDSDHLLVLQEKMNRYLAFIESGELYERFPDYRGSRVIIKTYFMRPPDDQGIKFLELAGGLIEKAGFGFEFRVGLG